MNFPNPLQLCLGRGQFSVVMYSDEDGYSVRFRDTGHENTIGDLTNEPEGKVMPKAGEVYLHFTNRESVLVVLEQLCRVVAAFDDEIAETTTADVA